MAYLSADESLEPDLSLTALFLYDARSGDYVEARADHLDDPWSLYAPVFTGDGGVLVIGSGGIYRYDRAAEAWSPEHALDTETLSIPAWNGDGTGLAYSSAQKPSALHILDLTSGEGYRLELESEIVDIAWSGDGRLAVLTRDHTSQAAVVVTKGEATYGASEPVQVLSHGYTQADQLNWIPGSGFLSVRVSPARESQDAPGTGRGGDIVMVDSEDGQKLVLFMSASWHFWLDQESVGIFIEEELRVFNVPWRQ